MVTPAYNIAIDASRLSITRTGIDYVTYYLLSSFYEYRQTICPDMKFTIFTSKDGISLLAPLFNNDEAFELIQVPLGHPLFRQQIGLLWALVRQHKHFDLFHSMGFPFPLWIPAKKKLLTVYDVAFKTFPNTFTLASQFSWNCLFPRTIRIVDGTYSISQTTESELFRHYPAAQSKYSRIIPPGLSPHYLSFSYPADDEAQNRVREKFTLPSHYVLCVGTLQPRKNLVFLLEVMKTLWERHPEHQNLHLVLTGNKGWKIDQLIENTASSLNKDRIHLTGYIEDEKELAVIYSMADVFTYPSIYEGFGLPPLEAMACGTPVITSNQSCLPETINKFGTALPLEKDVWIKAILEMADSQKKQNLMRDKAIQYARLFQWPDSARKIIQVYRDLL